mgnify:CR=1 FL=1
MSYKLQQNLFPIIVLVLSLANIARQFEEFILTSLIVSVFGIIGACLHFFKVGGSALFMYLWILPQFFSYQSFTFTFYANHIPDLTFGFPLGGAAQGYFAHINFVTVFLLVGYQVSRTLNVVGKWVIIQPAKKDSIVTELRGQIKDRLNLGAAGKWYLIQVEDTSYIIKPKGEEMFKSKDFTLGLVKTYDESTEESKLLDWGKIRILKRKEL